MTFGGLRDKVGSDSTWTFHKSIVPQRLSRQGILRPMDDVARRPIPFHLQLTDRGYLDGYTAA